MRGFLIFLGFIGRFYWMLITGIFDSLMVIAHLKRLPPTGQPYWRWKRR